MRISDWSSDVCSSDLNTAVQDYNTTIRTFPDIIGAKIVHGAKPMTPYRAVSPNANEAPKVDFGQSGAPRTSRGAARDPAGRGRPPGRGRVRERAPRRRCIGRAWGRGRVCEYVWISVVAGAAHQKK